MNYEWYCGYLTDLTKDMDADTRKLIKVFAENFKQAIERDGDYIPSKSELDAAGVWFDASINIPLMQPEIVYIHLPGAIAAAHAKDPQFLNAVSDLTGEATAECTATAECEVRKPKKSEAKKIETAVGIFANCLQEYFPIRQGQLTNNFDLMTAKHAVIEKKPDGKPGKATITRGNYTVTIDQFEALTDLNTSSHQLLNELVMIYTETGNPDIRLPLKKHMELRGLKDRKSAKNQAAADLDSLSRIRITGEEKAGGNTLSYRFMNFADSGELDKNNGDLLFSFGKKCQEYLKKLPVAYFPLQLLRIKSGRNPYSYALLHTITEHKRRNTGKANENRISVRALLKATDIPSYEEVKESGRQYRQRIIEPFERDLEACCGTEDEQGRTLSEWRYCHKNGQPLTDEELGTPEEPGLDYKTFVSLLVEVVWNNFPEVKRKRHPRHP